MVETKPCLYCGQPFKGQKNTSKFCSQSCSKAHRKPAPYFCLHCKKEIVGKTTRRRKRAKFCCKECFDSYRTEQRGFCPDCGDRLPPCSLPIRFCSMKCRVEYNRVKPRNCIVCDTLFSPYRPYGSKSGAWRRRKTCSDKCSSEQIILQAKGLALVPRAAGIDHHRWKGGTSVANFRGSQWKRLAESIRARDKYKCQICGKTQADNGRKLEVHHIIPFHNINNTAKANRRKNLITLCQSCHQKEEHKVMDKQLVLPFVAVARAARHASRPATSPASSR